MWIVSIGDFVSAKHLFLWENDEHANKRSTISRSLRKSEQLIQGHNSLHLLAPKHGSKPTGGEKRRKTVGPTKAKQIQLLFWFCLELSFFALFSSFSLHPIFPSRDGRRRRFKASRVRAAAAGGSRWAQLRRCMRAPAPRRRRASSAGSTEEAMGGRWRGTKTGKRKGSKTSMKRYKRRWGAKWP